MALPMQFRDLCRACMKRRDDMRMFFFSRINSVDVASMLTKIALLPVEPSDSLPKVLCSVCIKKLNDAYNFQQMCIKSHITFNDMLQSQQWPQDGFIKKEPFEMTISAVESQADVDEEKDNSISGDTGLLDPKIEPGCGDDSQVGSIKNEKSSKSSVVKSKKFTCNFCRDVFETWNELAVHIAEHKTKSSATGDESSCEVPEKKRKISQASTSKEVFPSELGFRIENFVYDGPSGENSSSLDGLPLEPICNVQVKEELNSENSGSEYDEEGGEDEESINNKYNPDGEEDPDYAVPIKTEKTDGGGERSFVNSKSPVCEMCGFKPKIPALMHAHVRNRHPDNYMEYVENLKASGEWVVKCRICDVYLFSSTIYGQHLKYTHSQIVNDCTGYFECNMCDQTFNTKNDFFLHKNQAHNMRRINKAKQIFMCLLCDKQFNRYTNLQQHEDNHDADGTGSSTANIIRPGFKKKRTELPAEVVVTPVGATLRTPPKKTNADITITTNGKFQCHACEKSFGNEFGLRVHIGCVHKGMEKLPKHDTKPEKIESKPEKPQYTDIKPSTAIAYSPTTTVANTSTGGKFQCHGCEKSFATEFGLRVHIGCVHKGMEKLPPKSGGIKPTSAAVAKPQATDSYCEICEKQFDSVTDCGSHMSKHYEVAYSYRERAIRCKECKHESYTRSEFKHHIKQRHKEIYRKRIAGLATMDPKFEACNMCFMPVFHTKMIRHMNSHYMGEKERRDESDELITPSPTKSPSTVSKLSKFLSKDHLTSALQQPNGKTIKLKCKTCSKFYPDKSSLMKHMLTFHKKYEGHTNTTANGRKVFNCKICFRSISGLQNFNSHMSSHRGSYHSKTKAPKNSHSCHLCSGIFGEKEDLQKHLVVAHSFNPMIFYKK